MKVMMMMMMTMKGAKHGGDDVEHRAVSRARVLEDDHLIAGR